MRAFEKIVGESASSLIILVVGIMIISSLAKQSEALRDFSILFYLLFGLMFVAIALKIVEYIRRH